MGAIVEIVKIYLNAFTEWSNNISREWIRKMKGKGINPLSGIMALISILIFSPADHVKNKIKNRCSNYRPSSLVCMILQFSISRQGFLMCSSTCNIHRYHHKVLPCSYISCVVIYKMRSKSG